MVLTTDKFVDPFPDTPFIFRSGTPPNVEPKSGPGQPDVPQPCSCATGSVERTDTPPSTMPEVYLDYSKGKRSCVCGIPMHPNELGVASRIEEAY